MESGAPLASPRSGPRNGQAWRILGIVLAIAFVLRLYNLSSESLWIDEAFTWNVTNNIEQSINDPGNPPVYYILEYLWTSVFGHSESALRFPSVVFNLLSIVLLFGLARQITSSSSALLAAGILALSPFHIYYSQEARSMALYTLIVLAATLLLLIARRHPRRWTPWIGYVLVALVGLYTHFAVLYFLAGHALFMLIAWLRREDQVGTLLRFTASGLVVFLGFLPWLIRGLSYASQGGQVRRHLLLKLPQAYFSFLFGDSLIPMDEQAVLNIRETLLSNLGLLVLALVVVICLGTLAVFLKRFPLTQVHFVMAIVPPVLCWVVSFKIPMFDERYFLAATPFLYLAIADIAIAPSRLSLGAAISLRVTAGVLFAALCIVSLYNYYWLPRIGKEQWRDVVRDIETATIDPDQAALLFDPGYVEVAYRYYQQENMERVLITSPLRNSIETTPQPLIAKMKNPQELWLIQSHNQDDRMREILAMSFETVGSRAYPRAKGITVVHFKRGPAESRNTETGSGAAN